SRTTCSRRRALRITPRSCISASLSSLMKPNASLPIRKRNIPKTILPAGSADSIVNRSLPMASEHITRAYDEELRRLGNTVAEMGGLAESQLGTAMEAVMTRDSELAAHVVE